MSIIGNTRRYKYNYNKIAIAFLIGCVAVLLFLGINKTTFRQMLGTVQQLTQPDPKLILVNNIFRSVVTLDQMQRLQALQNQKPSNSFINSTRHVQAMLDTLRERSEGDSLQVKRILSMKKILFQRDNLFLDYLYIRANLRKQDTLLEQFKNLSDLVQTQDIDSSLIKTEKKTNTTVTERSDSSVAEKPRSFFQKLFGKKTISQKKSVEKVTTEELKVTLDTTALLRKDSVIRELGKTAEAEQANKERRRNTLSYWQLQLTEANSVLITQLLTILKTIEAEEIQRVAEGNQRSTQMINDDLQKMDVIFVLFILSTAILIYLIITDISKSARYRKQLIEAKETAEQLGQVKQRFLANMSHELRTPLQAIIGATEQMRQRGASNEEELHMLYHSSRYLLQIVNQVLDYSSITSGRIQYEHKPFNMLATIKEVENAVRIQANEKSLVLKVHTDIRPSKHYSGDAFRLKQILFNLLGNAIKFTDRGFVSLEVTHSERKNHSIFTFTVKDTGVGMQEEDIRKIFTEFETLKKEKGTGLGLSIAQKLIEGQNGSIRVESIPGKGSTFTVNLPYSNTDAAPQQPIAEPSAAILPYRGLVWIIDDDTFIRQLCESIFKKHHIRYKSFASPTEVLQEPIENYVSLVFSDIRLPDMSGLELCRKLRAQGLQATFIALTAQVMPDEKETLLQNGFDGLLLKPFTEEELLQAIFQQTPPTAMGTGVIDLSALQQMADNDPELITSILQDLVAETKEDIEKLNTSLGKKEYPAIADCLHKLAGRLGQTGMRALSLQLRKLEIQFRKEPPATGSVDELKAAIPALTTAVAYLSTAAEHILSQI